jgi:autotransporter-associated beta strand protein
VTSAQAAYSLAISNGGQVAVGAGASLSVTTGTSVTGNGTLNVDPNGAFSTGGTLTLDSGGSLIGGPITAAAYQLNDGTSSAKLSGPGGLTKDTGGTVTLSGSNSYTGGTLVKDGTLIVANASALPDGTSLTIGAGGIFVFGQSEAAPLVTLTWNGVSNGKWTDAHWSGAARPYPDNTANAFVQTQYVVQVTSAQAANALAISNGGQVAVGPDASLSVTTDTSVTANGTLNVDPNGAFSTGGTLTLDSGGSLIGGPIAAAAYQLNDGTSSAKLSGPGGLTKDTGGAVTLSGPNSYTGGTLVKDGKLTVVNTGALPDGTSLTIGAGGIFVFDPSQSASSLSAAGTASASVVKVTPLASATPAAISNVPIDAVFTWHRPALDQTASPADTPQVARQWAWLAAFESSADSSDQDQKTGWTAEAVDRILLQYGL